MAPIQLWATIALYGLHIINTSVKKRVQIEYKMPSNCGKSYQKTSRLSWSTLLVIASLSRKSQPNFGNIQPKKTVSPICFLHFSNMGSIRSSKVMATGLIILVLLNFAATTFAQSYSVRHVYKLIAHMKIFKFAVVILLQNTERCKYLKNICI